MNTQTMKRLSKLDPDKVSVQDVAELLRVFRWTAKIILETAVRRGEFEKRGEFYALIGKA